MEGEENQDRSMNGKYPGKLINLNAPLLSTRRTNYVGLDRSDEMSNAAASSRERIPFSWEQTPGKPKINESSAAVGTENDDYFLPPRPPPGRWSDAAFWEYYFNSSCRSLDKVLADLDAGCDGDVDDDNDRDGVSSNTLDIFSLAESVDTNETHDRACCRSTLSSMENQLEEPEGADIMNNNRISPSSIYMIQRFLPDAKALAAASSSSAFTNVDKKKKDHHHSSSIVGSNYSCISTDTVSLRHSSPFSSSSKGGGCGLDILLPWRMKAMKSGGYGVRSPVLLPTAKPPPWSRGKLK